MFYETTFNYVQEKPEKTQVTFARNQIKKGNLECWYFAQSYFVILLCMNVTGMK